MCTFAKCEILILCDGISFYKPPMTTRQNFNIKIDHLIRNLHTKEDYELYAFACVIQSHFESSVLTDLRISNIQKLCGCGNKTAARLLKRAKESDLFVYDAEKNYLRVKSMRTKEKRYNRKNIAYRGEFVYAFPPQCAKSFTLKDWKFQFRRIKVLHLLKCRKNRMYAEVHEVGFVNCDVKLHVKTLAKHLCFSSVGSVSKFMRKLVNIDLNKKPCEFHFYDGSEEGRYCALCEHGKEPIEYKGRYIVVYPCLYGFKYSDIAVKEHYQIYGHRRGRRTMETANLAYEMGLGAQFAV